MLGRKIGFTNPATWREFKLDTPIWAYMYDKTVKFADKGRTQVLINNMVAPRIEPEIVLQIGKNLEPQHDETEISRCIQSISIGFEIVDCHYPRWEFSAADAVADFGVHGMLIVGSPLKVDGNIYESIVGQLKNFEVELIKDGVVIERGQGKNALGSPLLALSHLVNVVSKQEWAAPISAGEIITTGTLTPLPSISSGESWSVGIKGIGLEPIFIDVI